MEKRYVNLMVYLDLPNGEVAGVIDAGDSPITKIEKALDAIFSAGAGTYGFTVSEMDVAEDEAAGIVLTHNNA